MKRRGERLKNKIWKKEKRVGGKELKKEKRGVGEKTEQEMREREKVCIAGERGKK